VRGNLTEGLQIVVIGHTKMVEQFTMLRAMVSFATESVLGRSPTKAFWLVDRLEEVIGQIRAEQVARRAADAELEALWSSATRVQSLALERADGMSSLVTSLSLVAELIEDRIDVTDANEVCWGTRLTLAATLSHFPKLGTELDLLVFERNVDLTEVQVDSL
jgi:hypothetical protein